MAALDEAHRSAPTYAAEEARAQAFGARALNEFRNEHHYTTDDDQKNHFYAVDLANAEGLYGGHSVDKHVGKTDEQLAQRLRDQQVVRPDGSVRPEAASSYKDLASAQRLTQETLDDMGNAEKIERWLDRLERQPAANERSTLTLDKSFTDITGRTVTRADYDRDGLQAGGSDTRGVNVVLRYKRGLEPPFIVLTSMPTA
ncbi:RNase A-like domain-containing protein [Streptomyces sp. MS1.AVA.4]|uniref:RNase A-like domain-containing protein n=1 Tax=Streptomyces pratisoli TaxID=3139917 RepID=A0ACC6QQA3_9ACTN